MSCRVLILLAGVASAGACAEPATEEAPARQGSKVPDHFADGKAIRAKRGLWRAQWQKPNYLKLGGCGDAAVEQSGCRLLQSRIAELRKVELADGVRESHLRAAADLTIAAQRVGAARVDAADTTAAGASTRDARVAEMQGLLRLAGYLQAGSRDDRSGALKALNRVATEGKPSAALRQVLDDSSLLEPNPELKSRIQKLRKTLGD